MSDPVVIIVLCGVGTFLLRVLPIWRHRQALQSRPVGARTRAFLEGIGPAAITALVIVSVWPMMAPGPDEAAMQPLAVLVALASIWLMKRLWGGVAGPTLAGALLYGLLVHGLSLW